MVGTGRTGRDISAALLEFMRAAVVKILVASPGLKIYFSLLRKEQVRELNWIAEPALVYYLLLCSLLSFYKIVTKLISDICDSRNSRAELSYPKTTSFKKCVPTQGVYLSVPGEVHVRRSRHTPGQSYSAMSLFIA